MTHEGGSPWLLFVCRFLKSEEKNRRELTACVPASLIDDAISERVRVTRGEDTRIRTIAHGEVPGSGLDSGTGFGSSPSKLEILDEARLLAIDRNGSYPVRINLHVTWSICCINTV